MARIYGLISMKTQSQAKVYFIIMENLDYLPSSKVLFRYDLKFSEVNRLHISNFSDVQIVFEYLNQSNPLSQELTLYGKASMNGMNKAFENEMDKGNKSFPLS